MASSLSSLTPSSLALWRRALLASAALGAMTQTAPALAQTAHAPPGVLRTLQALRGELVNLNPVYGEALEAYSGPAVPREMLSFVGFICGLFGMTAFAGLMKFVARWAQNPLGMVKLKIGPLDIDGGRG